MSRESSKPLVSIIIPCYNCGNYINETLKSIDKQVYRNIEVICIDDGSDDDTYIKLNRWKDKSSLDIIICAQENSGVSNTRNYGISISSGDYIVFLDADDCIHSCFVNYLVQLVNSCDADSAFCCVSNDARILSTKYAESPYNYDTYDNDAAIRKVVYGLSKYAFCTFIYRKELIDKNRIRFDTNTRYFEDREFNFKYLAHCSKVCHVSIPLYWYRRNDESATKKKNVTWYTDSIEAVVRSGDYLKQHGCSSANDVATYLYERVIWGMAKKYARAGRYDLFKKLDDEYPLRKAMSDLRGDNNLLIKVLSSVYIISPSFFYCIVRFVTNLK